MKALSWNLQEALWAAGILLLSSGTAFFVYLLLFKVLRSWASKTSSKLDDSLVKHSRAPLKLFFPLLGLWLSLPALQLPGELLSLLKHLIELLIIFSLAWLGIRGTYVAEDLVMSHYDLTAKDNLQARKIYTQVNVLKKITISLIFVLSLACILMSFEELRKLGLSLLASAGLAGLVLGLAAQRTIATLIAGIQIAITQPIRIDDVVVVEGEWGRIEEITLTYVVVRIWDLRRLILPISYFLEKPFQNWTRTEAAILGTVYLYTDYTIPVQAVREELGRILKESPLWDGKVWALQVTEATPQTVELRALMSAPDSSTAWNLRCEVREKLIDFIQRNYPQSLPRVRAELEKIPLNPGTLAGKKA
ncbi:mechanosensitive ion channel [Thermosulfurimonas marina]|uniref:Mechanosensitive ion channel n=1 Tax=Thermosulfurimonas marina TaxID=2047767 RepID=A0A6H1WQF5_9BACT|nr:mechanosensitive ion channel domain-containing protein [Thermosulfurimonas marina]QJA05394.1 mechanosensitive ion channel [Thermosulfurimonas marina]